MSYDNKGYPVRPGDLIRVPHFGGGRQGKRKHWMYKKVVGEPYTGDLRAVCLVSDRGESCRLDVIQDFEIIDSPLDAENKLWYERKRQKVTR